MIILVKLWQSNPKLDLHDTRFPNYTKYSVKKTKGIANVVQSILSPRRLRMVIRMSSIREFLHVGRHRRSFARHGFIFTFHASLRRFIEFQNFVSPTYVDLRRDASSKSGRIRGRWMRSRIWFFVIHLRGWKYSCIHDGYRVNPSNPFDRFLGLSTPWMQIRFRRGIIWSLF